MSDQSKYVNAYIDTSVGMLHENLSVILQTKAQLKVANEMIAQKDATISNLESQIQQIKSDNNELASAKSNATRWESDYNAMKSKVAHMDTLLNQMADMKKLIQQKDVEKNAIIQQKDADYKNMLELKNAEVNELIEKIAKLQAPKKSINRKKQQDTSDNTMPVMLPVVDEPKEAIVENNDF